MQQQQSIDATQLVYPTVVAWPEGAAAPQLAALISSTGALDPATARLCANRQPPAILGCFNAAQSAQLVTAIRNAGGDAFAPSMADIAAFGQSLKVKDIRILNGNLEVDIWRGLTTTIRREHVQFLVRGSVKTSGDARRARRIADKVSDNVTSSTRFTRYSHGARYAAQRHIDRLRHDAGGGTVNVSEKLDIHTFNGTVFQVDGDKFAYSILGEMKGYGDKANMDLLCELLAHIAPDEVVDTYFPLFRAPHRHDHLLRLVPEMRRSEEDASFAFYSRWAALLYRHVMGA